MKREQGLLREASRKERTQRRNHTFLLQLSGDAIINQRMLNTVGSPASLALVGQLKMGIRNMLPMRGAWKSSLRRLSVSVSRTSYILSTTV